MNNKQAGMMNTLAVQLCSASDTGVKTKMEEHSMVQSKQPQLSLDWGGCVCKSF